MCACRVSFSVDRGGTFTDIFAVSSNGNCHVLKLLSVDPDNYEDSTIEGIRRILEKELKQPISGRIDSSYISAIRMGTTVATNALLERKGEPFALLVTKGFKDVLYIGNQARPNIFDLKVKCSEVLYETVVEVDERIILKQEKSLLEKSMDAAELKRGITGEEVLVVKKLNESQLVRDLKCLLDKGITCIAVSFLHSYLYSAHENRVKEIALSMGFKFVAISSEVMPMVKLVPRGLTTCADAYLTPHIKRYISGFANGFTGDLKKMNVLFMQSDGGLTSVETFSGSRAILSGPAGGVVGYAYTTLNDLKDKLPVIGFDMGGTSTDVSRFDGTFEHTFESITAGVAIQAPQLDIQTVAAGGGSKLFFRSGLFVVGPESVGAFPGPFCYRNGGSLSITDANLCLGRIVPKYFPQIFGKHKNEPLDKEGTIDEFRKLVDQINGFMLNEKSKISKLMTVEEAAMGFIKVANEAMCRPIRSITQGKGFDTSKHILACFGGAGGQHCCAVAKLLGIQTVYIHRYASILSAVGMALADVVHEEQHPAALEYCTVNFNKIDDTFHELKEKCCVELRKLGFVDSQIGFEFYLNLRYEKTDFAFMTRPSKICEKHFCSEGDFENSFLERYQREFGFKLSDRKILVDDIRVRASGHTDFKLEHNLNSSTEAPVENDRVDCYFENYGFVKTSVYSLNELNCGAKLVGPCILLDKNNTVLVEPECTAEITEKGNIRITVTNEKQKNIGTAVDPIQLSIFSHRFMSIAEEMGKVLQRTAISTNIKERLDFSCALFGPDGGLVSNAPHIPVHLGAMQEAVQFQLNHLKNNLGVGDVILSNHPMAGGSHLPDLTVITPVFHKDVPKPVFFVANRGHHADIGGITPGSMPPHSTLLSEEGASFVSFKLVEKGVFQEARITELLTKGENAPNFIGTRNLSDNLSDLKAQIAGNHKGIALVNRLIDQYGLEVVQAYMKHIQENAEIAVRDLLKQIAFNSATSELFAEDFMDDGTAIKLRVSINKDDGSAVFDFTGTGVEVYGNCNTPKAVTLSAIIYCLRCMVGYDVPLNQGCLKPIKVVIPKGCLLWPSDEAAVVGGNVTTSQRVVDVVLLAFEACAASQGCMNNVTFGDSTLGYYETIAGGAGLPLQKFSFNNVMFETGAGPSWHGRSGIHTHMTNTRITDVEIIEKRYPVIVQKFSLNPGSGGEGLFNGGDGVIRELLFRRQLVLSVLSERRVFAPYGLKGGKPGKRGVNILQFKSGRTVNLGSKASVKVEAGDVFHIETPGAGGFGEKH